MKYPANRILLIATRQIGDVLLVTPLLRSLRRAYPYAKLDVLVYDCKGGMLEGNSDYNHLISVAEHPTFKQYLTLGKHIFRRYDLVVSTLTGDRPLIYALLAAPRRVSLVPPKRWQDMWKRFVTQAWIETDNTNLHTVMQNLKLADILAIPRCYEIVIPQSIESIEILNRVLPFVWQKEAYAVLHLLPMWHYKRWTISGFTQVANFMIRKGLRVVLTGGDSQEEQQYIRNALLNMPNSVVNLAGQLSFSAVAQLIKSAQLYLGPDTAVTHLAAATGVFTVALYGPTNPLKWAPLPYGYAEDTTPFRSRGTQRVGNVLLVQGIGKCVPCHQEGCERHKRSYSRCLDELEGKVVIEAIENGVNI